MFGVMTRNENGVNEEVRGGVTSIWEIKEEKNNNNSDGMDA